MIYRLWIKKSTQTFKNKGLNKPYFSCKVSSEVNIENITFARQV